MKIIMNKHRAGKPINFIRITLKDKKTVIVEFDYFDDKFKGEIRKCEK